MVWSSSAAAANKAYPGSNKFTRVTRHVFRRTQIDVAAFNASWDSCIGLGRKWEVGNAADALNCLQHGHRAYAAIAANHVGSPFGCFERKSFGAGAVQAVSIFINGRLSYHLEMRG